MPNKHFLQKPQFTVRQVADATGISDGTIRNWFARGILSVDEKKIGVDPESIGFGRLFTCYTVMLIAIMGRLTQGGLPPVEAKEAAKRFVFVSDGERRPCFPFGDGETLLIVPKGANDLQAQVIRGDVDGRELSWREIYSHFNHRAEQIEILRVTELWQSVFQRLNVRATLENIEETGK
jgi:hypothetical protein